METQISEKRFEKLEDFNLVYLVNLEKLTLNEIVPGSFLKKFESKIEVKSLFGKKIINNPEVPESVIQKFNFGDDVVVHEGIIYKKDYNENGEAIYESFNDSTELVNQVLNLPVLNYTLKTISNLLGKAVMSKDLLSLPGFKLIQNENLGNISLSLKELTEKGNKVRTCKLVLTIEKDATITNVDLGILNYTVYGRRL